MSFNELSRKMKSEIMRLKKYNDSMDSVSWGMQEGILITGNEAQEVVSLIEWKRQAMVLLNDMNLQEIAKEIGLRPGEDIAKSILPFIQSLKSVANGS